MDRTSSFPELNRRDSASISWPATENKEPVDVEHGPFGLFQAVEQPRAFGKQIVTGVGRIDTRRGTKQQLSGEMLFQLADFPAYQGLGDNESPRGQGKAAAFDHANKRMQKIPSVHC
jgi:hypothetical protein